MIPALIRGRLRVPIPVVIRGWRFVLTHGWGLGRTSGRDLTPSRARGPTRGCTRGRGRAHSLRPSLAREPIPVVTRGPGRVPIPVATRG